jgi:hypothetical protein
MNRWMKGRKKRDLLRSQHKFLHYLKDHTLFGYIRRKNRFLSASMIGILNHFHQRPIVNMKKRQACQPSIRFHNVT